MANIAIPGMAVAYHVSLLCVLRASTNLSQHGVGVEPLLCLDFWDHGRACARGRGGGRGMLIYLCMCGSILAASLRVGPF